MVDFLAGLLGILWLASGAVDSCWTTITTSTRPAIARHAVNDSVLRALHVRYSRKTAPDYALCFCGLIIPEIMLAY